MNATEMMGEVRKAEIEIESILSNEITEIVNKLSKSTGLNIGSINIKLCEVTSMGDSAKQYATIEVIIDVSLPDRIWP